MNLLLLVSLAVALAKVKDDKPLPKTLCEKEKLDPKVAQKSRMVGGHCFFVPNGHDKAYEQGVGNYFRFKLEKARQLCCQFDGTVILTYNIQKQNSKVALEVQRFLFELTPLIKFPVTCDFERKGQFGAISLNCTKRANEGKGIAIVFLDRASLLMRVADVYINQLIPGPVGLICHQKNTLIEKYPANRNGGKGTPEIPIGPNDPDEPNPTNGGNQQVPTPTSNAPGHYMSKMTMAMVLVLPRLLL